MENVRKTALAFVESAKNEPQLIIGSALVGSAVTAVTILSYQFFKRLSMKQQLSNEIQAHSTHTLSRAPSIVNKTPTGPPKQSLSIRQNNNDDDQLLESLIREQLSRNYSFLQEDGMKNVRKAFVVVVGLGGVGSHAAHMLVRSGVSRIRVIDFDQVTLSSLNRHAVATQSDVGKSKTATIKLHFERIAPHAIVETRNELFSGKHASRLLEGNPDFVLDCIDNVTTKIELLKYCYDNKINVISSMGSGAKADPTRVCIGDISETNEDPLARATRRGLRKLGVNTRIPVVYSIEKPTDVKLLPLEEEKVADANEYSALENFRVRILPVLGTIPAMFGCAMATFVLTKIADFKIEPMRMKLRKNTYIHIYRDLKLKYEKDPAGTFRIDHSDIAFIFEEVWRGRSAVGGALDRVTLTRWDRNRDYSYGNLVAMTRIEAEQHEAGTNAPYTQEVLDYINERFRLEKMMNEERISK